MIERRQLDSAQPRSPKNASEPHGREPLLKWKARDGMDSFVHFTITQNGITRTTGRNWSTAKNVGKKLGSLVVLAGLLSGRISYGPAALSQHYLGQKSEDTRSMRWKNVSKVTVNENEHVITLIKDDETEMRVCCTPETFDSVTRLMRGYLKTQFETLPRS